MNETMMTKDEIEVFLNEDYVSAERVVVEDLARTALALHQQLADAQAAQTLVVERAEKALKEANLPFGYEKAVSAIRALADPSGVEALAALRAGRDRINQWRETAIVERDTYSEERDALAAKLAAAEARVGALMDAMKCAKAIMDTPIARRRLKLDPSDERLVVFRAALTTPAKEVRDA